jgi:hypothetical protein
MLPLSSQEGRDKFVQRKIPEHSGQGVILLYSKVRIWHPSDEGGGVARQPRPALMPSGSVPK